MYDPFNSCTKKLTYNLKSRQKYDCNNMWQARNKINPSGATKIIEETLYYNKEVFIGVCKDNIVNSFTQTPKFLDSLRLARFLELRFLEIRLLIGLPCRFIRCTVLKVKPWSNAEGKLSEHGEVLVSVKIWAEWRGEDEGVILFGWDFDSFHLEKDSWSCEGTCVKNKERARQWEFAKLG